MISIIIPAYNEEHRRIGETIERYLKYFGDKMHILIVLNGCTDGTLNIVLSLEKKHHSRLSHLELKEAGKGLALKEGFFHAQGELIGFIDADGATSPEEFEKLVNNMDGVDGTIASRWMKGAVVTNRTLVRTLASKGFVIAEKLLFQLPFEDTQCGAKLFRSNVIERVREHLSVRNMAIDVELLWVIKKFGFSVREVPTTWADQSGPAWANSPLKLFLSSLKIIFALLSLRIRLYYHTFV